MTQIQGDSTKRGGVVCVASIWYGDKEYPYIGAMDGMAMLIAALPTPRFQHFTRFQFNAGFVKGISIYRDVYGVCPDYCKALLLGRNSSDEYFISGLGKNNLDKYVETTSLYDGGYDPSKGVFNPQLDQTTMQVIDSPSDIRLTKLSPAMQQFITDNDDYGVFFNGNYNVNHLVDMVNQGNDILVHSCVKVESNLFMQLRLEG